MKTVQLLPWRYRGKAQIKITFDYDVELINLVRQVEGRIWSNRFRCWYTAYSPEKIKRIKSIFTGKAILDLSSFEDPETKSFIPLSGFYKFQLSNEDQNKINQFSRWLRQKRYSDNTVDTYTALIRAFIIFFRKRNLKDITNEDIIAYNHDFIVRNNYSIAYQRQLVSALKQFFLQVEDRKLDINDLEYPRKEIKLPAVFSKAEIRAIIGTIRNIKHRTAISLLYGAGLRISELLNLRIKDIDSDRHILNIHGAKGRKDRMVNLSDKMIEMLRIYYQAYRPKEFVFEGQNGGRYSSNSCRMVLQRAMKAAGIKKDASLHTLRHSYATHLHENGTDIHIIQALLGHKSVRTTEIYTHISNKEITEIRSPFDDL